MLAMSFAFGLAVFGTALAVGLRSYLVAAATEQREILDRITLESATHDVLGRLSAGETHAIRPSRLADVQLNGRSVGVGLSLPEGKHDPGIDSDATVLEALRNRGLLEEAGRNSGPSSFDNLEAMSRGWQLSAVREDCLRAWITFGRSPEEFRSEAAPGEGTGLTRTISSGDQVDVRAALDSGSGQRVLWMRVRFSGSAIRPWQVHDFRRLFIPANAHSCSVEA